MRGLVLGASIAFRGILPPALRHRVAASAAAVAITASSLLSAQPAAADTAYPVNVTFDNVKFTMVYDGCSGLCLDSDTWLEVYGTVGADTTAGAVSAGGLPYREFCKWGQNPCEAAWDASYGTTCTKQVSLGTHDFTKVFLCAGSYYQTCSTGYTKSNNTIPLQIHAGEQFKVTVAMQDYDSWSANDNVCNGYVWFGPYTAAELLAKKYVTVSQTKKVSTGYNDNAECWVAYHLS